MSDADRRGELPKGERSDLLAETARYGGADLRRNARGDGVLCQCFPRQGGTERGPKRKNTCILEKTAPVERMDSRLDHVIRTPVTRNFNLNRFQSSVEPSGCSRSPRKVCTARGTNRRSGGATGLYVYEYDPNSSFSLLELAGNQAHPCMQGDMALDAPFAISAAALNRAPFLFSCRYGDDIHHHRMRHEHQFR